MSFTRCRPPQHYWAFDGWGRADCECRETTAEMSASGGGWEIRLADGRPLLGSNRYDLPDPPGDTALRLTLPDEETDR